MNEGGCSIQRSYQLIIPLVLLLLGMLSCRPQEKQIFIEVDGTRLEVTADVATVRQALTEAGVTLGDKDRVQPDLWQELQPGMTITVTRVEERLEVVRETVPFQRRTVRNEAIPTGETRLLQLGVNGEDEVTYRVVLEDGVEAGRSEVRRVPLKTPVEEIVVVGARGTLTPVPIVGSLIYLSGGNAWVMRQISTARRPLTSEGDLDGRVFSLSPDGRTLLYSRRYEGDDLGQPLNSLWAISTTIVSEKPISLGIEGALYAEWSPDNQHIAYSTAERSPGPPGWKAHNDLWIATLLTDTLSNELMVESSLVLTTSESGIYSWWGSSYAWSPDGQSLAYARPDQVGIVDLEQRERVPLTNFPVVHTYSEWAWIPALSWSPDGLFLATVLHGPPVGSEAPEDSPVFDLWILSSDGSLKLKIADRVGMWAAPRWSQPRIAAERRSIQVAYSQAQNALDSLNSRYELYVMDRDGSNRQRVFPTAQELGLELPQIAWSPDSRSIALIYNNDLNVLDLAGGPTRQLTSDGQCSQIRWGP
jgi:Tol biopolymer transport system component